MQQASLIVFLWLAQDPAALLDSVLNKGQVIQLKSLPPKSNLQASELRCGDYFVLSNRPYRDEEGPTPALFAFIDVGGIQDRRLVVALQFRQAKFVPIIDNKTSNPTAQVIKNEQGKVVSVKIHISETDMKASEPCLIRAKK